MSDWLSLLLYILVCYRLSTLLTLDEGPLSVFLKIRTELGAYDYDKSGQAKTNLGRALTCPHCIGVWIAIPLSLYESGTQWYTLIWWLAIAGGSSFLWSLRNDS
jgi:hypothetical protein